jgi:predicted nucleic acid-binding protein
MMPFVLDNSVVMAWFFEDEDAPYADGVLRLLDGDSAVVPAIWPFEIANAIVTAERRRRLLPADTLRLVELANGLPITVESMPLRHALGAILDIGRLHRLTSYDAAYLELAMRRGLPLATLDEGLATAARQAGVTLVQ